VNETVNI